MLSFKNELFSFGQTGKDIENIAGRSDLWSLFPPPVHPPCPLGETGYSANLGSSVMSDSLDLAHEPSES